MNTLKFGNGEWYGKKDTILAYNDENSNYKPLPFNFSRASSATVINKDGLIEEVGSGQPRVDYLNNTKGALLLEPQRTNSLLQSNQFDTTWAIASGSITSGESGYDGSNNAWLLDSSAFLFQNINVSGTFCVSLYAKKGTANELRLRIRQTSDANAFFDLENGVVLSSYGEIEASIESVGSNGWYKCKINFLASGTNNVRIYSNDGDSIYIQNAQLEEGSYATSAIFTSGSAVTRLADSCIQTLPDGVINSSEGVFYFESKALTDTDDSRISLSDGNANGNNRVAFSYSPNINTAYCIVQLGGVQVLYNLNVPLTNQTEYKKFAIKWKSGDVAFWVDGVKLISSNSVFTAGTIDKLRFNNSYGGTGFKASVKDVRVYNTVLTDQELIALTQV